MKYSEETWIFDDFWLQFDVKTSKTHHILDLEQVSPMRRPSPAPWYAERWRKQLGKMVNFLATCHDLLLHNEKKTKHNYITVVTFFYGCFLQ